MLPSLPGAQGGGELLTWPTESWRACFLLVAWIRPPGPWTPRGGLPNCSRGVGKEWGRDDSYRFFSACPLKTRLSRGHPQAAPLNASHNESDVRDLPPSHEWGAPAPPLLKCHGLRWSGTGCLEACGLGMVLKAPTTFPDKCFEYVSFLSFCFSFSLFFLNVFNHYIDK